jgi:glycosyltransferase involved in cell wall biosynthesis
VISRPHNWEKGIRAVRHLQPAAAVIYDAEALFHGRIRSHLTAMPDNIEAPKLQEELRYFHRLEVEIAREADRIVAISKEEAAFFESAVENPSRVFWIPPMARRVKIGGGGPEGRRRALFLAGWAAGPNSANAEGLRWLAEEVLPTVVEECPWVEVAVTGAGVPAELSDLAGPHLQFIGHVQDLEGLHDAARLSVVPIRYGAGVKLKTVVGMQYGLPVVSTTVGAEGIPMLTSEVIDIADDPSAFAEAMIRLLVDDEVWSMRREALVDLNARWSTEPVASWADVLSGLLHRRGTMKIESFDHGVVG